MGEALGSSDLFPGLGARIVDSKGAACDDSAWTAAGLSSGSSVLFPGLGARIVDSKGAAGDDSAWTAAGLSSGGSVSNEASEPGDAGGESTRITSSSEVGGPDCEGDGLGCWLFLAGLFRSKTEIFFQPRHSWSVLTRALA